MLTILRGRCLYFLQECQLFWADNEPRLCLARICAKGKELIANGDPRPPLRCHIELEFQCHALLFVQQERIRRIRDNKHRHCIITKRDLAVKFNQEKIEDPMGICKNCYP